MSVLLPRFPVARLPFSFADVERVQTAIKRSFLVVVVWMALSGNALAHSFTAALIVAGDNREASLAEAVRGFLLAADERDGHANETSDGHLGGVDVHVLPLPRDAAALVEGLIGKPTEPGDVVVVLGTEPAASEAVRKYQSNSTVLLQVVLPVGWDSDVGTDSFVARYRLAYGTAPGLMAATGYHAARRLDVAIRPLDGVIPRAALEDAWRSTESGLPW
jgi:hypothetical protein